MIEPAAILNLVGSLLILVCTVFAALGVFEMSRVKWRETAIGRHLMSYMAVVAAIFLLSSIAFVTRLLGVQDALWFQVLRLLVFGAMPVVLFTRWRLLRRARRGDI